MALGRCSRSRPRKNDPWYRTHGNEHWEFDEEGLMRRCDMSANDVPIAEAERRYRQTEESL